VPRLVALDLPAGPELLDLLQRTWDAGDAVLPLDRRLPAPAQRAVLRALRPAIVVGPDGTSSSLADPLPVEPGDAVVVATSGTTGEPKGVVLTHPAVAASADACHRRLAVDAAVHEWIACLPLAHVGGLAVVLRALLHGVPLTLQEGFDAAAVVDAARRSRQVGRRPLVSLVPTTLGRVDPAVFDTILLGGAAPPGSLPPNTVVTYGMTETGSGVVYDGRPLDGVELAIGDGTVGAAGEILVRGPMLLRCYRDGTDPRLPGGWLPTGDGGALLPDGRLRVDGRLADVVVTGGEKVWPAAVERVLAQDADVAEVAVGAQPDPEWGQRVVAYVVARPGARPTLDRLRAVVKEQLGPWAAPRQLVLLDHLPRTSNGKVRRADLASLASSARP